MNEQFRHAFISNNRPKSAEAEQNDKIQGTQKSKVVVGDVPVRKYISARGVTFMWSRTVLDKW